MNMLAECSYNFKEGGSFGSLSLKIILVQLLAPSTNYDYNILE